MAAGTRTVEKLAMTSGGLRAAYGGRSVLLTGHTGFKGSWLSLWLHRLGARVHGYALRPPTEPSNFVASGIAEALETDTDADLRDTAKLSAAGSSAKPDVIFHLAAQPIVRESYRVPAETFAINVMGTIAVMEAVRAWNRPIVVVIVTSDKCYRALDQDRAFCEEDALGGNDPYSASKGAAEIAVSSYRASFFPPERLQDHGVKIATVRAGNVIGGGDWAVDRIVPDAARALSRGEPVPLRNPGAIRPWQHVLEPLAGYLMLGAHLLTSDGAPACSAWNLGPQPGDECSVRVLVERFCSAWGAGSWVDRSDPLAPREARILRLSIKKAAAELGWRPRWSLDDAVGRTARWYRSYYENPLRSMRQACLDDIAAYEKAWCEGDEE